MAFGFIYECLPSLPKVFGIKCQGYGVAQRSYNVVQTKERSLCLENFPLEMQGIFSIPTPPNPPYLPWQMLMIMTCLAKWHSCKKSCCAESTYLQREKKCMHCISPTFKIQLLTTVVSSSSSTFAIRQYQIAKPSRG